MTPTQSRTAVVTGGNRGIGVEICRQLAGHGYHVILTSRDAENGARAAAAIVKEGGGKVSAHPLDVTDPASIQQLRDFVVKTFGAPDVLVNNAAILLDRHRSGARGRTRNFPGNV